MTGNIPDYPLKFEPIYKQKVWGGRALEKLGRKLPGDSSTLIGESWEIADLKSTSTSGGGGQAAQSIVTNGKLKGKTLHELIENNKRAILGDVGVSKEGGFPLLIKFLDAKQNLSVQVHPSKEYAKNHIEAHLKNEAWYVVDAKPGAVIYKGIKEGVSKKEFKNGIKTNQLETLLNKIEVKKGDYYYLPSGTCHALGAGVLVAEVQTPSDTTFRVYDWGRKTRELHIDQALECIDFDNPVKTDSLTPENSNEQNKNSSSNFQVSRIVECNSFTIDCLEAKTNCEYEIENSRPVILMCVKGAGEINYSANEQAIEKFTSAATFLLPAAIKKAAVRLNKNTIVLQIETNYLSG